jgi:sugar phosphate isomerase/epimerase
VKLLPGNWNDWNLQRIPSDAKSSQKDEWMIKLSAMVGAPDLQQDTLAVYHGDLPAAFDRLCELEYDGIELMVRNPWTLDGKHLALELAERHLKLAGLCSGHVFGEDHLGLVGPDPENCRQAMIRLKGFIDFAGEFFGPGALINIGRSRGVGDPADPVGTLDRMVEAFQHLAQHASGSGVLVVLEPINSNQANFIHTTQEGLEIVRRVDHPNFGLMLDVYHMNIEDVSIEGSIREAGAACWFVHFADNNRKWPGSAHLDFGKAVEALNNINYDGFASLEILPWPDPDSAAVSSIQYLRRFIPSVA